METAPILNGIDVANRELAEARSALDELLRATKTSSHTETTLVTKVVTTAFERIRAAQESLLELQKTLASPDE